MRRRSRLALPSVIAITAGLAVITTFSVPGAGARAGGGAPRTGGTMRMSMPGMSMPAAEVAEAAAAARAPAAVELHRSVVRVSIKNFAFMPKRVVVSPGTRVVWTNQDSDPHTVTSDRPGFQSEAINPGGHYTLVAHRTGTFTYHCQIHPFMHGALVVQG